MRLRVLAAGAVLLFLAGAAATSAPVDCATPYLRETSPDRQHRLEVCRSPMFFAMPGQGSDAPGMAVLRDADGQIEGLVALQMVGAIDHPPRWQADAVELPLIARIAYAEGGATLIGDLFWRFRAWLRAIPRDEEFR